MLKGKIEFVAALVVIVIVLVVLALPYALTEVYGLKLKKLVLLMQLVVLAVFSAGMLIWWLVRYRQTSHDMETLRQEIDGKSVVATKVNVMLLKEGIGVGTNESKDDEFCPKCGRELIPTGDYYCPYGGHEEKKVLKEAKS